MRNPNRFVIRNDLGEPLSLNIEPEGALFPLASGDEVSVFDGHASQPVTVKLSRSEEGGLVASIWPGDGEVRVEKDGVDVLDMV